MRVVDVAMPRLHVGGAIRAKDVSRWVVLAFVFALSATLWSFTRFPMAGSLHGWSTQQCVRLEMQPQDWPCQVTFGRTLAVYLASSALVSLAALVPAVVLALRGRRVLAFVPMLAPLAITLGTRLGSWIWSGVWVPVDWTPPQQLFLGPWEPWTAGGPPASVWRPDHPLAVGVDLVLLAVPILVMIALFRPAKAPRAGLSGPAVVLACVIAAGAAVIIARVFDPILGGDMFFDEAWFGPALVMVSFGLLLPLGAGRPLWTIGPVACLVCLGGPVAIEGTLFGYTVFTFFQAAVPLALIGFAGAAASAFVARQRGLGGKPDRERSRRIRPTAIVHGFGLGMLAVTTVMAALDPAPFIFSTPLPTYLGARDRVLDLRSRMTLDEALGVAARYRAAHGSFERFDAAAARTLDPPLLWDDDVPGEDATFGPELTVRVVGSTDEQVDLVLVRPETTYCLRATFGDLPTYGLARTGSPRQRASVALDACGAQPWTPDLLSPFPIDRFCDDAPEIVMCRAVQRLFRDIIASPTGIA